MKSFDIFIHELFRMSEEPSLRAEIDRAYRFHEHDITKMVDREKGIYYAMVQDMRISPEWKEEKIDFDADHLAYVKDILSKPATRILNQSTGDVSANSLENWIRKTKRALLITQMNDFHKNFPKYIKSLELTLDKLDEIKIQLSLKKKKRGNRNFKKTLSLAEEVKIIHLANKLLKEDQEKYAPKQGAYVSEQLKDKVTDDLKREIPQISRHKVSRLLLDYYANIKAYNS